MIVRSLTVLPVICETMSAAFINEVRQRDGAFIVLAVHSPGGSSLWWELQLPGMAFEPWNDGRVADRGLDGQDESGHQVTRRYAGQSNGSDAR